MRAFAMFTMLLLANGAHASDLDALFAAERAFAASSPKLGVKAAFLGVLAEDALLFRPGPVNGREWYRARPDVAPFTLEWAPAAGEASGDLGYTYGPYRLTPRDAEGRAGDPAGGHFFSVWTHHPNTGWRLQLDQGIQHALLPLPTLAERRGDADGVVGAGDSDALAALDQRLNELRAREHPVDELRVLASADAVELRSGQPPQAFASLVASVPMRAEAKRVYLRISSDGRLAATAGVSAGEKPQHYQRAWRHGSSGWKLAVDLVGD